MRRIAPLLLLALTLAAAAPAAADAPNDAAAVEHALNRLTFGPRPGDVEAVRRAGLAAWIERQLHPVRIDDSALAAALPALPERPMSLADVRAARQFGRRMVDALAAAKLQRAMASERQLQEVLVDVWFNHFNVFARKGRTALYLAEYERDAIRPHVLGRFRDLLGATAKSPAMLLYLDNWLSTAPGAAGRQPNGRARGLNENYARELLELHTLGVDGGYTQQDIVNVARAFTGWTIAPGTSTFRFARPRHDRSDKVVLGTTIRAGGMDEGERVLDLLARHPATARHIASKLARRFVGDDPPAALVDRTAARFRETGGDLREVVRTIVTSPEFFAREARESKVKTPLEFVVSALRANGGRAPVRPALRAVRQLGMAPYMCQPPTGYEDRADAWISAGALVTRMNVAQQIAPGQAARIRGPAFQRK